MHLVHYARNIQLSTYSGTTPTEKPSAQSWHRQPQTWLPVLVLACALGAVAISAQQKPVPAQDELAMLQHMSAYDDNAQLQLGLAYREGRLGLEPSPLSAHYWLTRAAANGNAYAQKLLGVVTPPGSVAKFAGQFERVLSDRSIARVKALAEQGDPRAQFELAMRYRDGAWGVERDAVQSRTWLQRAAAGGNEVARRVVAEMKAANT